MENSVFVVMEDWNAGVGEDTNILLSIWTDQTDAEEEVRRLKRKFQRNDYSVNEVELNQPSDESLV